LAKATITYNSDSNIEGFIGEKKQKRTIEHTCRIPGTIRVISRAAKLGLSILPSLQQILW
jgi:hypothetical protein